MTGDELTVTGKTLGENVDKWMVERGHSWEGQEIIRPLNNPIKDTGHIRYVHAWSVSKKLARRLTEFHTAL